MLKKIKAFFYIFIKSFTSPSYYKELITSDISLSLKYYFTVVVLVAVIVALVQGVQMAPAMARSIGDVTNQAIAKYPENLEIVFKDGTWTINRPEPFIVPLGQEMTTTGDRKVSNLLVMSHTATVSDLDNYNALFVINSANIITKDGDVVQNIPVKEVKDLVVNKENFSKILYQTQIIANVFSYFFGMVLFAGLLLQLGVLKSLEILIGSVVLWGMGSFMIKNFTYKQGLKVALHTATLPLLVFVLANTLPFLRAVNDIPFWFLVMDLCTAAVMLVMIRDEQPEQKTDGTGENPTLKTQN